MPLYLLAAILAAFAQVAEPASPPVVGSPGVRSGDPTFRPAFIEEENRVLIPAEVEGVLKQLTVREGSRVEAGQVLAMIDDRQALAAVELADIAYQAAAERAKDDIEERYGVASAKVAKIDWQRDIAANQRTPNSVADIQVLQKRLVFDRAVLQTEKAQKDQVLAAKEADVKQAELKAANIALGRRTIAAPFAGEVETLIQRESQWVNPGDPILRLVRLDVLRVECFVQANEYDPVDVANRRVTVRAQLARDREAALEGRVTHVSQSVVRGAYKIRAEVQNQRAGDFWLIRPGLDAEMTIHLSEPPVDAPPQNAALPE